MCEHVITQLRAWTRKADGSPALVAQQCVDCLALVWGRTRAGAPQSFIPRREWPSGGIEIPDWEEPGSSVDQLSLFK